MTVDRTQLDNGYIVSTIRRSEMIQSFDSLLTVMTGFVGDIGRADLATSGLYETMVFPGEDEEISNFTELDFSRYETEDEAREGHAAMVEKWRDMPKGVNREGLDEVD